MKNNKDNYKEKKKQEGRKINNGGQTFNKQKRCKLNIH